MSRHQQIRNASYDSFGGRNEYDPSPRFNSFDQNNTMSTNQYDPSIDFADSPAGGTTMVNVARPGQKMQINLTLNNDTLQRIWFELFSAFNSFVEVLKPELVVASYSQIPGLSFEGVAAYPDNINIVDQSGNVMIRGNNALGVATIGCAEYPYWQLVQTTKVLGFEIVVTRISVATQAQFANNLTYFLKSYAGKNISNEINVRSYKKLINPAQLDIDVKAGMKITGESGIKYRLEVGEVVQLGLYINKWAKPTI